MDALDVHEFFENNKEIKGKFIIKILKKQQKIIKCSDPETRKVIIAKLRENKINAHTFQNTDEKNVVLFCRGIHFTVTENEILLELKEKFGESIVSVRQHATTRSKARGIFLDQHIINVKNSANIAEIIATDALMYHKVSIRKFFNKRVVQCLNCWAYGHTKTYCMREFKCIK